MEKIDSFVLNAALVFYCLAVLVAYGFLFVYPIGWLLFYGPHWAAEKTGFWPFYTLYPLSIISAYVIVRSLYLAVKDSCDETCTV